MIVVVAALNLFLVVALSGPILMRDCGYPYPLKITTVDVSGCSKAEICVFKRGSNVTAKVTFIPEKNYTVLRNGIYIITPFTLPFPGFTARDICSLGVKCPVTSGVAVTETLTLEVSKDLIPNIMAMMEWRIYNQNPNDPKDDPTKEVGCAKIIVIVQ